MRHKKMTWQDAITKGIYHKNLLLDRVPKKYQNTLSCSNKELGKSVDVTLDETYYLEKYIRHCLNYYDSLDDCIAAIKKAWLLKERKQKALEALKALELTH